VSEQVRPKFTFRDLLGYVLAYTFWILGAAISMLTLFMVRQLINVGWTALGTIWDVIGERAKWTIRPIDRFSLVFLGLLWLVYAIFSEQYFRMAITAARMRRLKARVDPSPNPPPPPQTAWMRHLRKIELDILARRIVPAIGIPILILGVAYGLHELAWLIIGR
jgi:hypothetical protein